MPARPATLDSLPDELLGLCLGLLPRNEGRSITLVNKRFWRLFFEQPRLWRHLEVQLPAVRRPEADHHLMLVALGGERGTSPCMAAKRALLRRVAPLVRQFVLRADDHWPCDQPADSFFRLLPASLAALSVSCFGAVPPATARLLRRLTALRRLNLSGALLPGGLPEVLPRLSQLAQLELCFKECFDPDRLMRAVAQLSSLTQLRLNSEGSARLRPPPLTAFPQLSEFEFRSDEGQVELAGVFCRTCSLGPAKFDGNALACLTLNGLDSSQPLVAVLDAVVPPSVQLQALSLLDSRFSAAVVQGCTQLAALQGLQLRDCPVDAAAGAALLASTPRVTALHLDSCSQIDVGALLRSGLPQLQMLRLAYYLHPLPPELARLTNLCKLVWLTHGTSPQASDVEVLRGLPRLHTLAVNLLSIRERTRVKKGLEASLPGVRIVQA